MAAALRRLANTALTAALFRLRAVAAATAARRLALRRWRGAAVVHALRTWRDTAALASRAGAALHPMHPPVPSAPSAPSQHPSAPTRPRRPAPTRPPPPRALRAFCAGKALRSVARLLVHRDVARGWRSWIALTAAHQRSAPRAERYGEQLRATERKRRLGAIGARRGGVSGRGWGEGGAASPGTGHTLRRRRPRPFPNGRSSRASCTRQAALGGVVIAIPKYLTLTLTRLHVVVWRVLQHQSVLALNTWRHGAAPHPAPHPVLHRALHLPPPHTFSASPHLSSHPTRPVAAERAATRLQLRKVIAAWASALLRAIVRGWAEAAQHEAAARRRVSALTADARAIARAWRTWVAAVAARMRALRLARGCLVQLVHGAERRAFNSLAAAAAPRACGRAVLRVWCTHLIGRAFRTWWGAREARGAARTLVGRAVGLWRGESAVRAWAAWRARTAAAVAVEESLARVLAHWRGGWLLRALNSWRAAADAAHKAWVVAQAHRLHPARRPLRALRRAVARERQMAHAIAHWWGGSAACAFNTWRSRAAAAAAQRERAYAAVARWWHVLRTAAWNSWVARAAAAAHARRQLVAALRFWRGCEVHTYVCIRDVYCQIILSYI